MIDVLAKDVMIPISRYVKVNKTDTLIDVIQALENARISEAAHAHRDAIVVDDDGACIGKITMLDIFRALEPNYQKMKNKNAAGTLTQNFIMKAVQDFNLWMEPMRDVCARGAHKTVSEVMHVFSAAEFIDANDSIDLALHKYVMGVHQPLIVKSGETVAGILRFGDVFEVTRQAMLRCPI
jgi:Mg2+/Co2+ transporter CorC